MLPINTNRIKSIKNKNIMQYILPTKFRNLSILFLIKVFKSYLLVFVL